MISDHSSVYKYLAFITASRIVTARLASCESKPKSVTMINIFWSPDKLLLRKKDAPIHTLHPPIRPRLHHPAKSIKIFFIVSLPKLPLSGSSFHFMPFFTNNKNIKESLYHERLDLIFTLDSFE